MEVFDVSRSREAIAVVMAKEPIAGQVNTRLISPGFLDAAGAAEVAARFLCCVVARLCIVFEGRVVVAVSPDESIERMREFFFASGGDVDKDGGGGGFANEIEIIGQGTGGDLGARMEHVWQQVIERECAGDRERGDGGEDLPVVFFGIDSPDVSMSVLRELRDSLREGKIAVEDDGVLGEGVCFFDVAAGATLDGGYWCLAARGFYPEVLRGIAWGGCSVFADTKKRAMEAGLRFGALADWYDVDELADLRCLVERLNDDESNVDDPALVGLGERLRGILEGSAWYK